MKRFRYDYSYKMLIANSLTSMLFLVIFVVSYKKGLVAFCIFGLTFLVCLFNTIVLVLNQGITIRNNKIMIVDYFWFTKIKLCDLKYVEIQELKKEKQNNLYGFLMSFTIQLHICINVIIFIIMERFITSYSI